MTNKNLIIKSKSSQPLLLEAVSGAKDNRSYRFSGVFTACSDENHKIVNRNGRIYEASEMLRHLVYLRKKCAENSLLGELDHPIDRFDTQLKCASHIIENIMFDPKTCCVVGTIRLLDTQAGNTAKELFDAGYPCYVSSRACGTVRPDKTVDIQQIITYDLVAEPGFEEAKLERVNESYNGKLSKNAVNYLNESYASQQKEVKNTKEKYGILCEGVTVCEASQPVPYSEEIERMKKMPINMRELCRPVNESDEETFSLPEADINPLTADQDDDKKKDDKKDSDDSKDDKKNDDKKEDTSSSEKEMTQEEKDAKRSKILGMEAISADGETMTQEEKDEKRSKILGIESIAVDDEEDDEKSEDKEDNDKNKEDKEDKEDDEKETTDECGGVSSEDDIKAPNEIKTKEQKKLAKEVEKKSLNDRASVETIKKQTKSDMQKVKDLINKAKKVSDVKESIVNNYQFSISLSDDNFAQFAALQPAQKNKVQKFIVEHNIVDVQTINELWKTPLIKEQRELKNWIRLASDEDKRLFAEAPLDVQDAIEESAKYVMIKTKEDCEDFWAKTGLRQRKAASLMNENVVQRYAVNESAENASSDAARMLGYNMDYFKMLEDMFS